MNSSNEPSSNSRDTLPKIFRDQVSKHQDRVALRYKKHGIWKKISWTQFFNLSRKFGLGLLAMGFQKGDKVNILSEDRPEWLIADLGTICISGISIGIYPTNSPHEVDYIVGHSEAKILVVEDEEQLDKVLEVRENLKNLEKIVIIDTRNVLEFLEDPMILSYDDILAKGEELFKEQPGLFEERIEETKDEDIAIMVYTSGTTGPPKGAMLRHKGILAAMKAQRQVNRVTEKDEVLCYLPLCHVAERIISFFQAIATGYTVNFAESIDTVNENLMEISPSWVFCPPRIWEKFHSYVSYEIQEVTWFKRWAYFWSVKIGARYTDLEQRDEKRPLFLKLQHFVADLLVYRKLKDRLGLKKAKFVVSGAAPISPEILRYFHSINCPIREGYGQTESGGGGTIHYPNRIKIGTVGEVVPDLEMKIAEDGEILMKGDNVFAGYYRDPKLTAETIVNGWLHTGDIGEFDEEGYLKILDRKKDIIITAGGKNITPQYIENMMKFSPYIEDAVVIGDARKYLVALVLVDEENCTKYAQRNRIPFSTFADLSQNPQIKEMIESEVKEVNKKLARVEQIKKIATFDKKLKEEDDEITPTMKIKRKKIMEKYSDLIETLY
ncbi:AMP-dependent synthetase/ligase [Thermodesulfobacteriota bacterium]